MIVAFIGDNGHVREQAAAEYIAGFVGIHSAMAVDRYAAEELDIATLTDAVSTIPFLSPRRLVLVRDFGTNKVLVEHLESIASSVADTTDLVIIERHIDGRSKYLTQLKKIADVREFAQLDGDDLIAWIIEETKRLGGSISRAIAMQLVDRVGTNQQLIANELAKLVLFDSVVSKESVQDLTTYTPQSSIFAMLDAAFAGNVAQALSLYGEQRTQGMEPLAILGMITWQLHALSMVRAAGNMPVQEIASRAKMSPFVVRKNQSNARRISDQKFIKLLEQAINTDKLIKTTHVDTDDAMQTLILSFA